MRQSEHPKRNTNEKRIDLLPFPVHQVSQNEDDKTQKEIDNHHWIRN
ncbi:MAG: hypothetical protein WCH85_00705 [Methanomicrobiales archaeon]